MTKPIMSALTCLVVSLTACLQVAQANEPIDIGNRRELFVDHFLIDTLKTTNEMTFEQRSTILSQARGSFRYQLTGYLALKNMLALVNNRGFFERMENYSYSDFSDWLDRIDQQGTTTGQ